MGGSTRTGHGRGMPTLAPVKGPVSPTALQGAGATGKPGRSADFLADAYGVVVPTSRSRMVEIFECAGLPSRPTASAGTQYTLPCGSLARIMEPSGHVPLRASFTNANEGPVSPFTGKPVQPPSGLSKAERREFTRSRNHVTLGP
jgi:hypothetical protein